MKTQEDYEKAAKRFIDGVVDEITDATELTRILNEGDGTLAEWREANPEVAAEADRLAERIGFDIPNSDDSVWQACDALREFLSETGGYGADVTRRVTVTLAGGGPSGWIEFIVDSDGDLVSASVSYCDWFQTPVTMDLLYTEALAAYDRYGIDALVDTYA